MVAKGIRTLALAIESQESYSFDLFDRSNIEEMVHSGHGYDLGKTV